MFKNNKFCCGCKEVKPTELFSKNKTRSDGFQSKCKDCSRKFLLEWRRNNPEIVKETRAREYHVDHLIPLQHPLVCGLHVPFNLRPITASDNLAKNNKFTPYVESDLSSDSIYR